MKCPKCKLINPDSAQRCDCGYDFETHTVEEPNFKAPEKGPRLGKGLFGLESLKRLGILVTAAIVTDWLISSLFGLPSKAITLLTEISLNSAIALFVATWIFGGACWTLKRSIALAAGFSLCLFAWAIYTIATVR